MFPSDLNQNKRQNVSFNCCTIQPVFVSCLMSFKPESSPESSFELFTAQSYFISSILLMLCDASVPHFFVCIFGDTSSRFDSSQALRFRVSSYAGLDSKTVMHVGVVLFFACRLLGRPCLWRRSGVSAASGTLRHAFVPVLSSPFSLSGPTIALVYSLIPSFCHSSLPNTVVFQTRPKSV